MDIKNKTAGPKNGQAENALKVKLNNFFIEYFNYLAIVVALIILATGSLWLLYPRYQKAVAASQAASASWQKDFAEKSIYYDKLVALRQSYELVSPEERSKIEAMVPVGGDTDNLITQFEAIALKNGAILNSIKITNESPKSSSKPFPGSSLEKKEPAGIFDELPQGIGLVKLEVNLSSVSYPVLKNIIKTIENNLRLLDIYKIGYPAKENKVNLVVYAYYLKAL